MARATMGTWFRLAVFLLIAVGIVVITTKTVDVEAVVAAAAVGGVLGFLWGRFHPLNNYQRPFALSPVLPCRQLGRRTLPHRQVFRVPGNGACRLPAAGLHDFR